MASCFEGVKILSSFVDNFVTRLAPEKTQANSRSRVSKNIGDFNLFMIWRKEVSLISLVKTGNTSNWTLWSVDFIKIFILILLLSFYFPNLSLQNFVK